MLLGFTQTGVGVIWPKGKKANDKRPLKIGHYQKGNTQKANTQEGQFNRKANAQEGQNTSYL